MPTSTLECAGSGVRPPGELEVVRDSVALPTATNSPNALQTSERTADDSSTYYFAKTGLWFRTDASFTLSVPSDLRADLAIGWGSPSIPSHEVTVDCAGSGRPPDWFVVPGGYWVTEPMCATLDVHVGEQAEQVQIGLGHACPGQQPPVQPSDG